MTIKWKKTKLALSNSSCIELTSKNYVEPSYDEQGNIIKLDCKDGRVGLKETFTFNLSGVDTTYEIAKIEKAGLNHFLLITEPRNKTTIYMLPALGIMSVNEKKVREVKGSPYEFTRYGFNSYLVNAYIGIHSQFHLGEYLFLKYRYSNNDVYQLLENYLADHPLFIQPEESGDFVYMKYRIPAQYKEDIGKFITGKYSRLSKELKSLITEFHELNPESNLYQILTKGDKYRKKLEKFYDVDMSGLELEALPDIKQETINLD